jgi:hypothetical protein
MPKIRRENLPRPLYRHLLDRVWRRQITTDQLEEFLHWLETEPEVSSARWFKRFPNLTVCGQGELVKTFLRPDQAPLGSEIE